MTPTTTPMPAWLESAWLARYLDRQLGDEESAWFEAYLLDKPELLGMVEADTLLAASVQANLDQESTIRSSRPGAIEAPSQPKSETSADHLLENASNVAPQETKRISLPAWSALAASLVFGTTVGWVANRVASPHQEHPAVIANPERITFDTMRGMPAAARIEQGGSNSRYALIEVSVPSGATNITMAIDGSEPNKLVASADGFVTFLVERSTITREFAATIRYEISGVAKSMTVSVPPMGENK